MLYKPFYNTPKSAINYNDFRDYSKPFDLNWPLVLFAIDSCEIANLLSILNLWLS